MTMLVHVTRDDTGAPDQTAVCGTTVPDPAWVIEAMPGEDLAPLLTEADTPCVVCLALTERQSE